MILWGINHPPKFTKEELDIMPTEELFDDSKSGLSDKDGYSVKGELIEAPVIPNPLDRIELQWQPPIIRPPHISNVDP
jgi:hypothetical protein